MLYDRPVRELLRDAIASMPPTFTREDIAEWFDLSYPRVNRHTVYGHFLAAVANSRRKFQSRVGDLVYKRPDRLFERYNPEKHGPAHKVVGPKRERDTSTIEPDHEGARQSGLAKEIREALTEAFGCAFETETLPLMGGGTHEFDLVSEDDEMVGIHVPLGQIRVAENKFARIAEAVWLLQGLMQTASRFVLVTNERQVAHLWLQQYAGLARGVEFFLLDGDHVIDLKEGL